jgi:hypothetical protein
VNITRTHTMTIGSVEIREALKMRFPRNHVVQAMPDKNGNVSFECLGVEGGLRVKFSADLGAVEE